MKTFAQLGVLREMNRARIPVHAVVGLEWGAVMAAVYAHQGQINDAEWKAYKLRDENLPEAGFLQSKASAAPVSKLNSFFEAAFGNSSVQSARIPFACAAASKAGERAQILNRGSFRETVSRCVPYPPMYQENGGWLASPFSIEEAAAHLRAQGANVIVLIDVLGQGEFLPSKSAADTSPENLMWVELRREMYRAKAPVVNNVIHINTSGHPVTDFNGRRALMDAGQKAATDAVNKMVSQYGF
jgi:predicted acylesterase/phospholipase RssA